MKQGRQAILYQTDYAEVTTPDSERQPPCTFVSRLYENVPLRTR